MSETPPNPTPTPTPAPTVDVKDYEALKAKVAEYESKAKATAEDLPEKAKAEREAQDKKTSDFKALTSAVEFNVNSKEFLKTHSNILPKETADIFTAAEKETYDSPVQKAQAIKAGIVSEFFKVQANLDLLTQSHKNTVDGFLKLTKNGKEQKAQEIYENILEPAIEMLKRVKKAEEVNRSQNGLGNQTDSEKAYEQKMKELSQKHYLKGLN